MQHSALFMYQVYTRNVVRRCPDCFGPYGPDVFMPAGCLLARESPAVMLA